MGGLQPRSESAALRGLLVINAAAVAAGWPELVLACAPTLPVLLCGREPESLVIGLGDWSGLVRGRTDQFDALWVVAPVAAGAGWYGPFRVTASDGRDYGLSRLMSTQKMRGPRWLLSRS